MPTLFCQNGQHEWDRPAQRGRKPLSCPDHPKAETEAVHQDSAPDTAAEEAKAKAKQDTMAKAREAKIRKAEERREQEERAAREKAIADAQRYAKELPEKVKEYGTLLNQAKKLKTKEEVNHAFNKLDNLQQAIITMNQVARKAAA